MSHKQFIHFRVDDDLLNRIDAFAAENRLKRSKAARMLIQVALGDCGKTAAIMLGVSEFQSVLQRSVNRLATEITTKLPQMIEEELGG